MYYFVLQATTLYCLVTEYAAGGELLTYIKMHQEYRLSEDKSRTYVRQLVSALHYLHERGVAHRWVPFSLIDSREGGGSQVSSVLFNRLRRGGWLTGEFRSL